MTIETIKAGTIIRFSYLHIYVEQILKENMKLSFRMFINE